MRVYVFVFKVCFNYFLMYVFTGMYMQLNTNKLTLSAIVLEQRKVLRVVFEKWLRRWELTSHTEFPRRERLDCSTSYCPPNVPATLATKSPRSSAIRQRTRLRWLNLNRVSVYVYVRYVYVWHKAVRICGMHMCMYAYDYVRTGSCICADCVWLACARVYVYVHVHVHVSAVCRRPYVLDPVSGGNSR
jgi:hypothetical protein